MKKRIVFVHGLILGAVAFVIAKALIPESAQHLSTHDLALAHRIGFTFPPLVGLWVGWAQGSLSRMILGMSLGSMIGLSYASLCGERFGFLGIMIGYPMFCGGLFAMLLGVDRATWVSGLLPRLLKGLTAGLVCGFAYTLVLNILLAFSYHPNLGRDLSTYSSRMWQAGPFALALGGGVFLVMFRWALGIGSTRPQQKSVQPN